MRKVLQIRGSNAVGKTTSVRQFVERHRLTPIEVVIRGQKTDLSVSPDYKMVVLGRYDVLNGGCDRFKNREHVISTIKYAIAKYRPMVVVFEGFIYGKTFKFAKEIFEMCRGCGYSYLGVVLVRSPKSALEKLYSRNGGERVNEEAFFSAYKASLTSYRKLLKEGVPVVVQNTDKLELNQMYRVIEDNL